MTIHGMALYIDGTIEEVLTVLTQNDHSITEDIDDKTEYSQSIVTKRLDWLAASECIEYVHKPAAQWRLVEDPWAERDDEGESDE